MLKPSVTIFLLSLLVLCISCEKITLRNDLEGNWNLWLIGGRFSGNGMEKNFDQLEFINNRKYEILRNDSIVENGEYSIYRSDKDSRGTYWRIDFDRNIIFEPEPRFLSKGAFRFYSSDTLEISDTYIDGFGWVFIRND